MPTIPIYGDSTPAPPGWNTGSLFGAFSIFFFLFFLFSKYLPTLSLAEVKEEVNPPRPAKGEAVNRGEKGQGPKPALMGIFTYLDDLLGAVKALKRDRPGIYSLVPSASGEIKEDLQERPQPGPLSMPLRGGHFGLFSGFAFWRSIRSSSGGSSSAVSRLSPGSPFVIVGFEFLILFGVLTSFFRVADPQPAAAAAPPRLL